LTTIRSRDPKFAPTDLCKNGDRVYAISQASNQVKVFKLSSGFEGKFFKIFF
jgi:hypothetical protein